MRARQLSGRRVGALAVVLVIGGAAVILGVVSGWDSPVFAAMIGALLGALAILLGLGPWGTARGQVRAEADIDRVSGLPGAERLHADLAAELADPDSFGVALHVCALQGMAQYNDAYGEICGDAMIAWLARKLTGSIGERGQVYRLRGATFAVVAGLADPVEDLPRACSSALLEVGEGFVIRGAIGRALLPSEAETSAAGLELATRRAIAERAERPGDSELRPPQSPLEVLPTIHPRYQVAEVAARIGRRMGLEGSALEELEAAAHLRDVGNMALPSVVLGREGELEGPEWDFVRLHTIIGERLLAANFGMESVARLVRSSHERWDGEGYPDGLSGEQIPLGARILFVCSAFQDMTSERPHRPAYSATEALANLDRGAGTQFDPDVVLAFQGEFAPPDEAATRELGRRGRRVLNILVADDDAASRFLLARAIDAAGQKCTMVSDGIAAWRTFRRVRPDVVICDSRLPKMNADRLCRRIRQDEPERQTYFVTLVALQEGERIQRDLEVGADDFLAKPFDREDLQTLLAVAFNEVSLRQDPLQ
ncbi:MAG TPA: HD domain-containing phosphohydrolase [Solirubrobacteraceae bacterium]|nr:HD domain-containing phosphohydrolase [Solirubrobacteraceae bacterium]